MTTALPSSATERTEFRNVSEGVVGVVLINEEGKRHGAAVKPGDTIWMSREECIATANAPRQDEDNPFAKGWLAAETTPAEVENRREFGWPGAAAVPVSSDPTPEPVLDPLDGDQGNAPVPPPVEVKPAIPEEVGAPPLPQGDPATGVRTPGEEVGTPEVVATGKRPAAPRGQTVSAESTINKPAPKKGSAQSVVVGQNGPQYAEGPKE